MPAQTNPRRASRLTFFASAVKASFGNAIRALRTAAPAVESCSISLRVGPVETPCDLIREVLQCLSTARKSLPGLNCSSLGKASRWHRLSLEYPPARDPALPPSLLRSTISASPPIGKISLDWINEPLVQHSEGFSSAQHRPGTVMPVLLPASLLLLFFSSSGRAIR